MVVYTILFNTHMHVTVISLEYLPDKIYIMDLGSSTYHSKNVVKAFDFDKFYAYP